jgi:hypothetical protein
MIAIGFKVLVIDERYTLAHHDKSTAEKAPWLFWRENREGSV